MNIPLPIIELNKSQEEKKIVHFNFLELLRAGFE